MTQLIEAPENTRDAETEGRPPSATEVIRLVAGREISAKLRDKTFIISTAALLLMVVTSVIVPMVLSRGEDRPQFTVAAVGAEAQAVAQAARAAGATAVQQTAERADQESDGSVGEPGPAIRLGQSAVPPAQLTVRSAPDVAAAEQLIRTEDADAALVPGPDGTLSLIGLTEVDGDLSQLIALAVQAQNVTNAGLGDASGAEAQRLLSAPPPAQRLLDPPPANAEISLALGFAFAGLFFLTSFIFGLMIAQSVVEEKQSRVVELLVAAIPVRLLLLGKVTGSSLLALGQVVVLLAAGLAGASVAGQSASAVVTLLLHSGGWFLAFFALGFSMLSCLWAAAGALAPRQEDLQATTLPMQLLVGVPFFLSVSITEPGRWMTVLSYVPFSAPLSMPRRLMLGDAAWWEPVLASLGMVATGAVLVLIATRLYEGALLRTANRISLRAAWLGNRLGA